MSEKEVMVRITVCLNGTDENPYHKLGLRQNPFPQLGEAKYDAAEKRLHKLGADPIPCDRAEEYIRETLKGFSEEFVALCVRMYRPGAMVRFDVHWPKGKETR